MQRPLIIEYYSDVLCVWSWIAQKRIDELNTHFGESIRINHHYMDVFGNTQAKMDEQWADRGHFEGFANHVAQAALPYESAVINPDIWRKVQPTTSSNVHLVLKAIELAYGVKQSVRMSLMYRKAFYIEAIDISELSLLLKMAVHENLDITLIKHHINSGRAMALLMSDYQQAKNSALKGSPTYIIDGGRQMLYGNVGYRILSANIEQKLKQPATEEAWC